jgi:hypothetical protein
MLMACSLFYVASAKDLNISLTEAVSRDLVNVTSVTSGQSYDGAGLALKIVNKGKRAINILVDTALVFKTAGSVHQDFVVQGGVFVNVAPMGNKTVMLQTYCTQSNVAIPKKDVSFEMQNEPDTNMLKVLRYTIKHKLSNDLTQKAIWVLTDHKDVNTVYEPPYDLESRNVCLFLALTLKKPIPVYYKYFELNHDIDSTDVPVIPLAEKKPSKIFATFKWDQKAEAVLGLLIFDDKGKVVQPIFEKQTFKTGHYEFNAKFETVDLPSGNYQIKLSNASYDLREIAVNID